jgi:hypothetical protein
MLIKCTRLMDGPGPSEMVVSVKTLSGRTEEVVVYTGLVHGDCLDVGPIIFQKDDSVLIELPRESASGLVRVWVLTSELCEMRSAAE